MQTTAIILSTIQSYINSLDWSYIITLIILCYGINHYKVKAGLQKATGSQLRTRYGVLIVGMTYGVVLYFLRGYGITHIENLLQSFVFAIVFHKFIIEGLLYWLVKQGLPESISRHLLDVAQLKKAQGPSNDELNEPDNNSTNENK